MNPVNSVLNDPAWQKPKLEALVESLLQRPDDCDSSPLFSRAQVRAMVLQAVEATRSLHPKFSENPVEGGFDLDRNPHEQAKYDDTVRLAILDLQRGRRGI